MWINVLLIVLGWLSPETDSEIKIWAKFMCLENDTESISWRDGMCVTIAKKDSKGARANYCYLNNSEGWYNVSLGPAYWQMVCFCLNLSFTLGWGTFLKGQISQDSQPTSSCGWVCISGYCWGLGISCCPDAKL